jgi:poly(3-hydroxybutyrate) depolymerase
MESSHTLFLKVAGLVMAFFSLSGQAHASSVATRKVACQGAPYRYLLLAPSKGEALPAVVLLHGAGDTPEPMIEAWRKLARKRNIALIAPELPRDPKFESLAPRVLRCVVEDAKLAASIDPARIYLFGNSMGGYLTYDAAMLESQYFAGAAVHAMGIADDYAWIVARAQRKMPVAIYAGDGDQLVPIESVRKTKELLLQQGFTVHYVELKRHDHNYYALADQINDDAWSFLKDLRLPAS